MLKLLPLLLGVTSQISSGEKIVKLNLSSGRRLADYDYRDKTLGNFKNYQYTASVYVGSRQ